MGRLIVVVSGKGGVGKSTVSVGLATAFCNCGRKVLLVDADEGLRCLDSLLSVSDRLVFDSSDVIDRNVDLEKAILQVDKVKGLSLLPAPDKLCFNKTGFVDIVASLTDKYDYVILDCPAGIDLEYMYGFKDKGEYIVVTNFDRVSVRDAGIANSLFDSLNLKNVGLIVNRFIYKNVKKLNINFDEIINNTGVRLLGVVPEDILIQTSALNGNPFFFGKAAMAFQRISARIEDKDVLLPKIRKI
ncbi:MAG: P-loop NTPase [bacterium]|nr:P-loop NTPase [bacterium]